jgi:hypothetical protein
MRRSAGLRRIRRNVGAGRRGRKPIGRCSQFERTAGCDSFADARLSDFFTFLWLRIRKPLINGDGMQVA